MTNVNKGRTWVLPAGTYKGGQEKTWSVLNKETEGSFSLGTISY